ncbi:MAG TPA: SDR family oxidoreductase [Chitinophagaceae bacterium]|jgi:Dehydrogenases with different specificities (related to short-chain alcohol dehydrogenases)
MKLLENKIAVVTGAGSGIGKAISLLYADEGAKIVVSDIDEKGGDETVREIKAKGGEAIFVRIHADKNIRINSVGPGYIRTPLLNSLDDATMKALVGLHPVGRLGTAEEIAELALWLSSDKASFVTGAYYNVDGGYLAQ